MTHPSKEPIRISSVAFALAALLGTPVRGQIFSDATSLAGSAIKDSSFYNAAWLDWNRDGRSDLVGAGEGVEVLLTQDSLGHFHNELRPNGTYMLNSNHLTAVPGVGDYDSDGWPDVLILPRGMPYLQNTGYTKLFKNNRDGSFTQVPGPWESIPQGQGEFSVFADFDGDGDEDLLLGFGVYGAIHNQALWLFRNNTRQTTRG